MSDDNGKLEFANDGELLKYLDSQGTYIVRTKDEDQAYWNNTVKKEVDTKVSEIYGSFESNINEFSGIEKNPNEKATEFLKRAFSQISDSHKATEAELNKKLEAKLKESDAAAEVTKQFETFKAQSKAQVKEFEEKIAGMETQAFKGRVNQIVTEALERIKPSLKQDLNPFLVENAIEAVKNKFEAKTIAKEVNGLIVFNDQDDKPIMSTKDGKMLTAYEILLGEFPEDIIDKPRVVGGAGTGNKEGDENINPQTGKNGEFDIDLPEEVKNVQQLVEYIKKAFPNVSRSSKDFNEYYRANKSKVKFEV